MGDLHALDHLRALSSAGDSSSRPNSPATYRLAGPSASPALTGKSVSWLAGRPLPAASSPAKKAGQTSFARGPREPLSRSLAAKVGNICTHSRRLVSWAALSRHSIWRAHQAQCQRTRKRSLRLPLPLPLPWPAESGRRNSNQNGNGSLVSSSAAAER